MASAQSNFRTKTLEKQKNNLAGTGKASGLFFFFWRLLGLSGKSFLGQAWFGGDCFLKRIDEENKKKRRRKSDDD
jgi:hypothetical protein